MKWNYLGNDIFDQLSRLEEFDDSINLIDSLGHGFVAHQALRKPYVDFWFEPEFTTKDVRKVAQDKICALQNSWTPENFLSLSREEILAGESLLSRVFRELLMEEQ